MKKVELRAMEQYKYEVIKNLVDHNGSKKRAKEKLNISMRQVDRLIIVYKTQGKEGFMHGNRGKSPKHTIPQELQDKIIELYKTKYYDANIAHFKELLEKHESIKISYSALYNILRKHSILSPKVHKSTVKFEKKKLS